MAKDAYYFSHDSNARTDTKIVDMMYDYGMAGYGMFWFIVEVMRESDCYRLENNRSTWRALGMQMHLKADELQKFIDDCIEQYRLFESDGVYFWSNSLVKRMEKLEETRAKRKAAAEKRWSNNANANKKNANALQEDNNSNANALQEKCNFMQSKVKESKVKESKENNNIVTEIISYLNEKTGKNFKSGVAKNRDLIKARLKEGYSLEDFKKVIDIKVAEWLNDEAMSKFLRPETLFSNKFEGYLNQKPKQEVKKRIKKDPYASIKER